MGNICIIGPRASGKTTYLAGLSYFSDYRGYRSRYSIQPLNEDARTLTDMAERMILEGLPIEATGTHTHTVDDLRDYFFNIQVKRRLFKPETSFQLNVRDYPGEVFEKIVSVGEEDAIHEEFIDRCFTDVQGCLLLFTEWESSSDSLYSQLMNRFLELMDERDRLNNYRLAVVMSKCERGEIWPGRLDPETDLFGVYLKRTLNTLQKGIPNKQNLQFFALSTFGVLSRHDPRPNRTDIPGKDGRASTLRNPPTWKPYNLIDPLYWLSTGQR